MSPEGAQELTMRACEVGDVVPLENAYGAKNHFGEKY